MITSIFLCIHVQAKNNKSFNDLLKRESIIILNYYPSPTSFNSTNFSIEYYNNSNKTIKYITAKFVGYDAVGGIVKDVGGSAKYLKGIGPIESKASASYSRENAWFTSIVDSAKVTSVAVEYMDGSKNIINQPNSITLSDEEYKNITENSSKNQGDDDIKLSLQPFKCRRWMESNHSYNATIVKIGHAAPLTGGISHLGADNANGACLAVGEINQKGLEIDGKKIELRLISEDDAGDPKIGIAVAQKLVDEKVVAVIGHLNSGVSIPASRIYNKAGIVQISPSSTNPEYTNQGYNSTYRLVASDDIQGVALAEYASKNLKAKTVAIVHDNTAYGKGLANEFEKKAKFNSLNIVAYDLTNDKATDFKSILTKIKNKNPDVIMYSGMDSTAGLFAKQAYKLSLTTKILAPDGVCTDKLSELAGNGINNIICSEAGVPFSKMENIVNFADKYKEIFDMDPQIYSPFTYDAVNVIVDAMKRANSTEPDKVLEKMPKTNLKGMIGNISFDKNGDMKEKIITLYNYINKEKTVLDTVKIINK